MVSRALRRAKEQSHPFVSRTAQGTMRHPSLLIDESKNTKITDIFKAFGLFLTLI